MPSDAAPPLDVFIVGSPRSGTTHLQRLLASHEQIASPNETHIFREYFAPMFDRFEREQKRIDQVISARTAAGVATGRLIGLPAAIDPEEFLSVGQSMYAHIRAQMLARKPGATVFLEKSPSSSLHVSLLHRLAPDAAIIHLVRSPHDVVASLGHVADWSATWRVSRSALERARIWAQHVQGAATAKSIVRPYLLVRYEELVAQPEKVLSDVLDSIGLPPLPKGSWTADAPHFLASSVVERAGSVGNEPVGFDRHTRAEQQPGPSRYERWAVSRVAADLAADFGYPAARLSTRPSYALREMYARIESAARGARHLLRNPATARTLISKGIGALQ